MSWNQNIDVAEHPTPRGGQIADDIGRALQQDDTRADLRQRVRNLPDVTQYLARQRLGHGSFALKMTARPGGAFNQWVPFKNICQSGDERRTPRLPDEQTPFPVR